MRIWAPLRRPLAVLAAACVFAGSCSTQGQGAGHSNAWDSAFQDRSGTAPLHVVAHYRDSHGATHRLEEWRLGQQHLRRKTDDRIDLHADQTGPVLPGQPVEYTWQILDLQKHVAHRVSTAGMLHLGMLYSYYSMAHLLTRPAGAFTVQPASAPPAGSTPLVPCQWWQIDAAGQPSTRVCWLPQYGLPAEVWAQTPAGWQRTFAAESIETRPIPGRTFMADTTGFQVRNVDESESDD